MVSVKEGSRIGLDTTVLLSLVNRQPPILRRRELCPSLFTRVRGRLVFSEVRLTAYCGTTATASISTKKSGCARPETNTPVIAGGLGVWGQAFWNAAKPACSDCPSTT